MYSCGGAESTSWYLCFIPGLDRRKAWFANSQLRKFARSLSKQEEIRTRRIRRQDLQAYGSDSSFESADELGNLPRSISYEGDDGCSTAFVRLPSPSDNLTLNGQTNYEQTVIPEIVVDVHDSCGDNKTVIVKQYSNGGLISDESLDALYDGIVEENCSRECAKSSWVSPIAAHRTILRMTKSEIKNDSMDATTLTDTFSTLAKFDHSSDNFTGNQRNTNIEKESYTRSKIPASCSISNCSFCSSYSSDLQLQRISADAERHDRALNGVYTSKEVDLKTSDRCSHSDCESHGGDALLHDSGAYSANSIPSTQQSDDVTISNIMRQKGDTELDDISTGSSDSRCLSYVSRPLKAHLTCSNYWEPEASGQPYADVDATSDISDTTFWSNDSVVVDELSKLISRDSSRNTLLARQCHTGPTHDKTSSKPDDDKETLELMQLVRCVCPKSPSGRSNPFNNLPNKVSGSVRVVWSAWLLSSDPFP